MEKIAKRGNACSEGKKSHEILTGGFFYFLYRVAAINPEY
jgi:hypothetical protein